MAFHTLALGFRVPTTYAENTRDQRVGALFKGVSNCSCSYMNGIAYVGFEGLCEGRERIQMSCRRQVKRIVELWKP